MHNIKVSPGLKEYQLSTFLEQQGQDHEHEEISLDLSFFNISNKNVVEQLNSFLKKRKVVELNCSFMQLDDSRAASIAETIKTLPHLRRVDFSHNKMQNIGAIALAQSLDSNPRLKLDVRFNQIGASGAVALTKSWASGRAVTEINLSNNLIGNDGARQIASCLKSNPGRVQKLVLSQNYITFEGDKALAIDVPENVRIFHRTKTLSVGEYLEKNPFMALVLIVFPFLCLLLPFLKSEQELEGCDYQRKGQPKYAESALKKAYSIDFFDLKNSWI